MFKPLIALAAASLVAGSAFADVATASGSGVFSRFPGYGYQYTASWEATAGEFTIQFNASSGSTNFPYSGNGWVSTFISFVPVTGQLLDVPTFDFTGSVRIEFINLATGAPGLPPQVSAASSPHRADFYSSAQAVGTGEIRLSQSLIQTTGPLTNAAGTNVLGLSFPQSDNNVLQWNPSLHFVAGNLLQPSPDPTCASISCMTPDHDALRFNSLQLGYVAGIVPEPSAWATFGAGLGAIVLGMRRRRPA